MDRMCVSDLGTATDSLDFYFIENGSVLCYGTVPADLLVKIVDPSRQSDRFVRPVVSPSENSRSGSELPKRTSSTTPENKFLSVSQI